MLLILEKSDSINYDFANYVLKYLKTYAISYLEKNRHKVKRFDESLNNIIHSERFVSAYNVIMSGIMNLRITTTKDSYVIHIDGTRKIPYSDFHSYSACGYINYGSLDTDKFPIFSNSFEYVKNNISSIYKVYSMG